jgi:hypothetical protein
MTHLRLVGDAAGQTLREEVVLESVRTFIERGVRELSGSNPFGDGEVESQYGYHSGYQPKPVAEQITRLRELFPELGTADVEIASRELPPNAEGWFAIPRWEKIAPTYNEAVEKVLALLSSTGNGKFNNWRERKLGPNRLRQHERTVAMLKKLGNQQIEHDILIVPAQFGLHHRGRSIHWAREVFNASEFGLGAFAVGIMLLTHPERFKHHDDLWIDCTGDQYDHPYGDGRYAFAPFFSFNGGRVTFGAHWFGHASDIFGSASGFVP